MFLMIESADQNKSKIEALVALKRYECPPPGHDEFLSSKIISRLESERLRSRQPWYTRWFHTFDVNPLLASCYVLGVCLLFFTVWNHGNTFEPKVGQVYRNIGLRVGSMGLMQSRELLTEKTGFNMFGVLQDRRSFQGYPSVQPVLHIPTSPVPWLRESTRSSSTEALHSRD
jgi:hypothetical protein